MQILTFQTAQSLNEILKGTPGAVTFIECRSQSELVGFIQIDATNNLASHVGTLQKNNPFPIYLRGYIPTADMRETLKQVNEQLSSYIFRLPWFIPAPKLLEYIEKNTQLPAKPSSIPEAALATKEEFIDIEELSKRLNISVPTLRRLEQNKKIPSIRTGRLVRFQMQQVINALVGAQNKK